MINKENLLTGTALIIVFCLGLIIGNLFNDKGRYIKTRQDNYYDVFDTKTGLIYRTGIDNNRRFFQKLDLKNGKKEVLK